MARKTKQVVISDGSKDTNRDFGKVFEIHEVSAYEAERWAADAFQALVSAGVEVPDDLRSAGTVAIAQMGLRALGRIAPDTLHDLLDRMLPCITYYPDPSKREVNRPVTGRPPFENDVEELSTYWTLRREVLALHAGFTAGASPSPSPSGSIGTSPTR